MIVRRGGEVGGGKRRGMEETVRWLGTDRITVCSIDGGLWRFNARTVQLVWPATVAAKTQSALTRAVAVHSKTPTAPHEDRAVGVISDPHY